MFNYQEFHPFYEHIDEPVSDCPYKIENFENFEDLKVQEEKQIILEEKTQEAKELIQQVQEKKEEESKKPVETKKILNNKNKSNMLCTCLNTDLLILIVIGYLIYRFMRN